MRILLQLALLCASLASPLQAQQTASPASTQKSNYQVQEFMVPMRDGVRLQTVVITKANQTQPLPILLTRTPYGVLTQEDFDTHAAKEGADWVPSAWKELAADGYILSSRISAADLNPKVFFCSPRSTTPKIPSRPTKPTMPTIPSTGW